eukprot:2353941-Rhodomonas_salina.1
MSPSSLSSRILIASIRFLCALFALPHPHPLLGCSLPHRAILVHRIRRAAASAAAAAVLALSRILALCLQGCALLCVVFCPEL